MRLELCYAQYPFGVHIFFFSFLDVSPMEILCSPFFYIPASVVVIPFDANYIAYCLRGSVEFGAGFFNGGCYRVYVFNFVMVVKLIIICGFL